MFLCLLVLPNSLCLFLCIRQGHCGFRSWRSGLLWAAPSTPLSRMQPRALRGPHGLRRPCCCGGAAGLCLRGPSGRPPARRAAASCPVRGLLGGLWVGQALEQLAVHPTRPACCGAALGSGVADSGPGGLGLGTALLEGKAKSWCR